MRKPTVRFLCIGAVGVFAFSILSILTGIWWPRASPVSVSPSTSFDGANSYGVFFVTNGGNDAIVLASYQVQAVANGSWNTVSETTSRRCDPSGRLFDFSDTLQPGEYRRISLSSSGHAPWRVCVTYQPQRRGLNALLVCAKTAWATRSLSRSVWRGPVFHGMEQAVSQEIRPASRF
jgi:hypothetical protein